MWRHQLGAAANLVPAPARVEVADEHFHYDSIPDMAAAVLARHPGPLALCGASMGGMIAMQAARQDPRRVVGLALLGTTARPETPEVRALREAAMALFAQGRADEVLRANVPLAFHAPGPALTDEYLALIHRAGAQALIRQNQAVIDRPDARPQLGQVPCPTLVLCGRQDQLTPLECSQEIAALVPHSRLRVLEECGHMLTMEQPGAVNAALADWWGWLRGAARPT